MDFRIILEDLYGNDGMSIYTAKKQGLVVA
jgi:hypothetical protein